MQKVIRATLLQCQIDAFDLADAAAVCLRKCKLCRCRDTLVDVAGLHTRARPRSWHWLCVQVRALCFENMLYFARVRACVEGMPSTELFIKYAEHGLAFVGAARQLLKCFWQCRRVFLETPFCTNAFLNKLFQRFLAADFSGESGLWTRLVSDPPSVFKNVAKCFWKH